MTVMKWLIIVMLPITMLMGLYLLVNFTFEPLGWYGGITMIITIILLILFIRGKI